MSSLRTNEVISSNSYYKHIRPWLAKNRDEIKKEGKEDFDVVESKGLQSLVQINDLIKSPTEEQKKIFHDKWIHELFTSEGVKREEKNKEYENALIEVGYTREQAKSLIIYSADNAIRAKESAIDNEKRGKIASCFMDGGIVLGLLRQLYNDPDSDPLLIDLLLNTAYGLSLGMRGYFQYHVYNRDDDEASMNRYQSDIYGNKIAGFMGNAATFTETKLCPVIFTLAGLLPYRYQDSVISLFSLPNLLWWRARMPAHTNQEFLTDLLRIIIHKPLSLFGIKSSKEVVSEIKERGNLEANYVLKRHCINAGLNNENEKDQKLSKLITQIFKLIRNSFSRDINVQIDSSKKAGQAIATPLGLIGLISFGIFKPVKLLLQGKNRIINLLASFGGKSQQIIYFFKMLIPIFNDTKSLKSNLNESIAKGNIDEKDIKERRELINKKRKLSYVGTFCFLANFINPYLKLITTENKLIQKTIGITSELADGLVAKFFSERRHVNGFKFKVDNPEFYKEEVQVTDSSDDETSLQNTIPIRALLSVKGSTKHE